MHCSKIRSLIQRYLDSDCSSKDKALVEKHLEVCPDCKKYWMVLNKITSLPSPPIEEPSIDLGERIIARIQEESRIKSTKPVVSKWRKFFLPSKETWWVEITVAACALLVAAWFVFGPSPYEEYYIPEPDSQYSYKPAGTEEWISHSPTEELTIKPGDAIKTALKQQTEIKLPNKTVVKLRENTEITIIGSVRVYSHKEETCEAIDLKQGEIYVETSDRRQVTGSHIKVETPAGDIIDRGTKFTVSVSTNKSVSDKLNPPDSPFDKGGWGDLKEDAMKNITGVLAVLVTVTVLEGQVIFRNAYGEQVVNAGETAKASEDTKPVLLAQAPKPTEPRTTNNEQRTTTDEARIKALIQQLGDDDWQKREKAQKELTELGEKLIEQYRSAKSEVQSPKLDSELQPLRSELTKLADALREGCKSDDPEIKLRANKIRQHFCYLTQPKIVFGSVGDGPHGIYVIDADGQNLTRLTKNFGDRFPSYSPDAKKIYFRAERDGKTGVYEINADGTDLKLIRESGIASPDGKKICFTLSKEKNLDIYVADIDGSNQIRLTKHERIDSHPCWSPDGKKIAFSSQRDGKPEIYVMDFDGKNQVRLTDNPATDWSPSWHPDGSKIAFTSTRDDNSEIYIMDASGKNQARLTNWVDGGNASNARWSPDGKNIAFQVYRPDTNAQIYVMDADGKNKKRLTEKGGSSPAWCPSFLPEISALFATNK